MSEHRGNVFEMMERLLDKGAPAVALSPAMVRQVLAEVAALVAAKNELVRENIRLRDALREKNGAAE